MLIESAPPLGAVKVSFSVPSMRTSARTCLSPGLTVQLPSGFCVGVETTALT